MNAYVTRIYDLSNLKKIPSEESLTNILPMRKISASKLFHHPLVDRYDVETVRKRISSQPDLASTPPIERSYSLPTNSTRSLSSCNLNHKLLTTSKTSQKPERSWCDIVQKSESCTDCWNEAWQKIINDLYQSDKVDSKTLEAVYLLRNAHIQGFFHCPTDDANGSLQEESAKNHQSLINDENGDEITCSAINIQPVRSESAENFLTESNETVLLNEMTSSMKSDIDSVATSSGRSTPSFRKKPKRPNIRISDHGLYRDYVEIRRTDSLSSLDSEMDRCSFVSDCSFVDIPSESRSSIRKSNMHETHEFEETLREDSSTPTPLSSQNLVYSNIKKICEDRPDSPTSLLLLPVLNSDDPMMDLHTTLSPMLRKFKKLEEEFKLISYLKEKLPALQRENNGGSKHNTLTANENEMINNNVDPTVKASGVIDSAVNNSAFKDVATQCHTETKDISSQKQISHENIETQCSPDRKNAGVQKYLELYTEVSHQGTLTEQITQKSVGVGESLSTADTSTQHMVDSKEFSCQNDILLSNVDEYTETNTTLFIDKAIGDDIADLKFKSVSIQESPRGADMSTQCETMYSHVGTMVGCPGKDLRHLGVGGQVADIIFEDQSMQSVITETANQSTEAIVTLCDQSTSFGCGYQDLTSKYVQHTTQANDFSCGDNEAEMKTENKSTSNVPILVDSNVGTDLIEMVHTSVTCNIVKETECKGVGDDTIDDYHCEKCAIPKKEIGIGMYENSDPCSINDKLCDCNKPLTNTVAVGDHSISKINCDKCDNTNFTTIGIGDDKTDDLLCDSCLRQKNNGPKLMVSVGVGEDDVNMSTCEKCDSNDGNLFNFDLNILNRPITPQQQAVLCHYCGNKVDLNDSQLDESLQAMRDNMKSISCGMKRATTSKNLNVEFDNGESLAPLSDGGITDDDEEDESSSGRNDVIEACQMLHHHFSGEKPLKQPAMMKYVGIIQALWFKTVKRRRANASVVKSYIDLFQQRIPELLETIINLSDDEGNTALHYALTYKNLGVVSILLDSGECAVDLANQAGYTPIMLAALVGFEKKNDKYIMQRLFRLGDINKESAENGQTPLMLAVSHGNMGIVELLLDAGCDINATDDEGSTALMCACEHGNINVVKSLLAHPDCDATIEDNEGSTALSIAMDARRKDLALLVYGSLNFDARGRIKLSPSKQSLLGLGRRSPSPVIGRR